MRPSILVAMPAWAMLALGGCAHRTPAARAPSSDPEPAVNAWRQAIARNDPHAAYLLLSAPLRLRITAEEFALQWKAAQADLSAQEEALAEPHAIRRASGELTDGRAWPLVRDPDRWRIAAPHPLEPGGDTPEDTLRRLVAAIDARDFDALLALLAEPLRTTLEQALADRAAKLKTAIRRGGVEISGSSASGSTARLRYDARYHIDLVQENGRWRVADFN